MPGNHALLSPSAAKRWLTCPPSARLNAALTERFGEQSSEFAVEGTTAHTLAELKLRRELGEINKFNYDAQHKLLKGVTPEMERNTDIYTDIVLEKYYLAKKDCSDAILMVEVRLDMSPWIPGCFGTADALIVSDSVLEVCDYKNGAGVPVDAVENPQARCYGLGALNEFGEIYNFPIIRNTIIQPRLDSVTSETLTRDQLEEWGEEIKPIAQLAWAGDGEYQTGEHCRFCKAKAICKARVMQSIEIFQTGFEQPGVLPDDMIPGILKVADVAEQWIKDIRAYALTKALGGYKWPGYKLVRGKKPSRAFRSEEEAEEQLIRAGYSKEQYMQTRMKTVAEIEKLLGKKAFGAIMGELVVQGDGNLILTTEDDKRVEWSSADAAFGDLGEIKDAAPSENEISNDEN